MRRGRGKRIAIVLALGLILFFSPALTVTKPVSASNNSSVTSPSITLDAITTGVTISPKALPPRIFAKSFILMDGDSSTVLAAKNPEATLPIASTTKMMTALVVMENYQLDDIATVPKEINLVPGSKINLVVGEKITISALLRGLLIQSGNDAAFTLAYHLDPANSDYLPFVAKMNELATRNHLTNTRYGDPAGLDDDEGRSTAFDLANVARLLLKNPTLAKIVATPSATITSSNGQTTHELKNSNRLILSDESLYLPQVTGIKTGFTPVAGHCLVSSYVKDGRTLIGVILNTDEFTITASAKEMNKLFTWAQKNVEIVDY